MTVLIVVLGAGGDTTAPPGAQSQPATAPSRPVTTTETSAAESSPSTEPQPATTQPEATLSETTAAVTTTNAPTAPEEVESTRDPAPDFTLELSDGSVFVLSAQQKPVYLVFWAEG